MKVVIRLESDKTKTVRIYKYEVYRRTEQRA